MLKVVCVMTGRKYSMKYVYHLRRMITKHLPVDHTFICLTDEPIENPPSNIKFINVAKYISQYGLKIWFAKMLIFNREIVGDGKILYIDLDMVIAASLEPLANLDMEYHLGICANFTRINQARNGGKPTWPCGYGSCVMLLGEEYGPEVWDKFSKDTWGYIGNAHQFGDQYIIEKLTAGNAIMLQDVLPDGYFLHYKDFTINPDKRAAVLVFAGKTNPADCDIQWITDLWYCKPSPS